MTWPSQVPGDRGSVLGFQLPGPGVRRLARRNSTQQTTAMNAVSAAHAADLTTVMTGRRRIGQRFGATGTVRLADLVHLLALAAGHFLRHATPVQVGLDLPGREVA